MINLKSDTNRDIFIYDNVFESHQIQKMYEYIQKSYFKLSMNDDDYNEYKTKFSQTFGSKYDENDLRYFGILDFLPIEIKQKFNMTYDTYNRCIVNCITPLDTHYPHDDSSYPVEDTGTFGEANDNNNVKWSLIFYCNLKWEVEWGGDTLFLSDDRKDINHISQCKVNRLVVFDAKIPHLIRPSTMSAPYYRWSINMTFRP